MLVTQLSTVVAQFVSGLAASDTLQAGIGDETVDDELNDNDNRAGRVTAKDFFGLTGSATGEEALAISRRKYEEKKAKEEDAERNRREREEKRLFKVAQAMTKASALLAHIAQGGEPTIKAMGCEDLKALLTNSNPQGPAPKGAKAALQQQVKELPSVRDALARFAASPPPPPPPRQPPPPPPPPPPAAPQAFTAAAAQAQIPASVAPTVPRSLCALHGGDPQQ